MVPARPFFSSGLRPGSGFYQLGDKRVLGRIQVQPDHVAEFLEHAYRLAKAPTTGRAGVDGVTLQRRSSAREGRQE